MTTLSRKNTYRNQSPHIQKSRWLWIGAVLLLVFAAVLIYLYVQIPADAGDRQSLVTTLFFFSGLFLVIYLASFMPGIGSWMQRARDENKELSRPNGFVVFFWVVASFLHLGLLFRTPSPEGIVIYLYQAAMFFTVGGFLFGLVHYFQFYSQLKFWHKQNQWAREMENRHRGNRILQECLQCEQLIRRTMLEDVEVAQMMRWNGLDEQVQRKMNEIVLYFKSDRFSPEDIEKMTAIYDWLKNVVLIIEQHPYFRKMKPENQKSV